MQSAKNFLHISGSLIRPVKLAGKPLIFIFLLALATINFIYFAPPASSQSDNCHAKAAGNWVDEVICSDNRLDEKNRILDRITRDLLAIKTPLEKTNIKVEQVQWKFSLNSCKTIDVNDGISPADCLISLFDMRIDELSGLLQTGTAGQPTDSSPTPLPLITKGQITGKKEKRESRPSSKTKPASIQIDRGQNIAAECNSVSCFNSKMEETEIELQTVTAELGRKMRETDIARGGRSSEAKLNETVNDFRQYREKQCRLASGITGLEKPALYSSCFIRMTTERANNIKDILSSID